MKKVILVFVWALILGSVFASCSKDINGPVDVNFIEGKWNFNKSTVSSNGFTFPYTTDYFKNEDGCNKDYIELLAGGIAKYVNYPADCTPEQRVGTWSISGNTLIIAVTGSSFNGNFEIAKLDASELILKINGSYEGQSGTLNLYFTK